jgi:hypothetical protein
MRSARHVDVAPVSEGLSGVIACHWRWRMSLQEQAQFASNAGLHKARENAAHSATAPAGPPVELASSASLRSALLPGIAVACNEAAATCSTNVSNTAQIILSSYGAHVDLCLDCGASAELRVKTLRRHMVSFSFGRPC